MSYSTLTRNDTTGFGITTAGNVPAVTEHPVISVWLEIPSNPDLLFDGYRVIWDAGASKSAPNRFFGYTYKSGAQYRVELAVGNRYERYVIPSGVVAAMTPGDRFHFLMAWNHADGTGRCYVGGVEATQAYASGTYSAAPTLAATSYFGRLVGGSDPGPYTKVSHASLFKGYGTSDATALAALAVELASGKAPLLLGAHRYWAMVENLSSAIDGASALTLVGSIEPTLDDGDGPAVDPIVYSTGWQSPGAVAEPSGGGAAWTNWTNVQTDDGSVATSGSIGSAEANSQTRTLIATDYELSIPEGFTPIGIKARIDRNKTGTGNVQDQSLTLRHGGAAIGSSKAATSTNWPGSLAVAEYGGAEDLWGASLNRAMVIDESLGLGLSVKNTGLSSAAAAVDVMQLEAFYTAAVASRRTLSRKFIPGVLP